MQKILRVNTGNVRHSPHNGVITSTLKILVTITHDSPVEHNGRNLVTVIDAYGQRHLVDEWFLSDPKQTPASLEEIKQAVLNGKRVYWKHEGYPVIRDSIGQWLINHEKCPIGLTHQDGKTLNGELSDFYIVAS